MSSEERTPPGDDGAGDEARPRMHTQRVESEETATQSFAITPGETPYFTTATGERVELPRATLEALATSGAPGTTVAADPEGRRSLTIEMPADGSMPAIPGLEALLRAGAPAAANGSLPAPAGPDALYQPIDRERYAALSATARTGAAAAPPSTEAPAPAAAPPVAPHDPITPAAPAETLAMSDLDDAIASVASRTPRADAPAATHPPAHASPADAAAPSPAAPTAAATEAPPAADEGGSMGGEEPGTQTSMDRADAARIEMRSEEIDEILTSMPGGLLRWGSTAVFATLVVLLGIAWYIRYPDVVTGRVSLTTPTPPVRVVSRTAGEVARVFVADRATVAAHAPLLLLKNPAAYDDVVTLSAMLDRLEPALQHEGAVPVLGVDRGLALGELQAPYSSFQQAYSDYRSHLADPFYGQKVAALQAQMATHAQLRDRLNAQQALLDEQLTLADRSRARSRQLATQNLSSGAEVDQAEQQYLQQRYASENGRTALANNEIQLAAQRAALLDLEQRRADDGQRLLVELRNAQHSLRAAISAWEQSYLLRSPVGGTVSLFRDLHENQFVGAQEPLVAVLPATGTIVGRVTLSGVGAGKVRVGQRAILQLDNFPYREYGVVEGRVTRISQLGFEQGLAQQQTFTYQADVALPQGLRSSYGRTLVFTQEMRGEVQVVTDDLRLLQRVLNQIRSLKEL